MTTQWMIGVPPKRGAPVKLVGVAGALIVTCIDPPPVSTNPTDPSAPTTAVAMVVPPCVTAAVPALNPATTCCAVPLWVAV